MKNFFGEQIYILGLERNDTKKWRDSFLDMLPKDKVRFWIEKGAQNTKNDGQLDTSFTSILSFNSRYRIIFSASKTILLPSDLIKILPSSALIPISP